MTNAMSDDELRATRTRLMARSDELRERLQRVRLDLRRVSNPLPRDLSDAAIVVENDEILEAIEKSAVSELAHIDHALERMDAGTFARCEDCGREIPAERLRAVPYAGRCFGCESN
jgi:RNA polymerase-binding transcription factor DksA